jgi:histidinol-phosphate/aromatic aminotransferase/cobyric acid decarboxylase-like protein/choline kinase
MQALILAAGMGKRLGKYTKENTKCMLKINNEPLIKQTLDKLNNVGIKKVILVVGYKKDNLISYLGNQYKNIKIEYIENSIYNKTNNIYSLYLAREKLVKDDTILLESDLIFDQKILEKLIDDKRKSLAVVDKYKLWMDGTSVILDEHDKILNFFSKEYFKFQDVAQYYKTVNIYKFSKEFSSQIYIPFLEAYSKVMGNDEYYESVLKVLTILDKCELRALRLNGEKWYEIDDIHDKMNAEIIFAKTAKEKLSLIQKRYGGYWRFPELKDFCYLVNPYFPNKKMQEEIKAYFYELISQYPSGLNIQNILAAKMFGIEEENIIVGNGAAEIIRGLGKVIKGDFAIPFPTFNEYPETIGYERVKKIISKNDDLSYGVDDLISFSIENNVKNLILINPDNPSGNFIKKDELLKLVKKLKENSINLILDESFVDFASNGENETMINQEIIDKHQNLIIIKSISKSYGVPGIRLGVVISSNVKILNKLKSKIPIWNINSFGEYFLQIIGKYKKDYLIACEKIRNERDKFYKKLSKISYLKVIPSQANYFLCELKNIKSTEFCQLLLDKYNIYIKDLSGKIGFENNNYIRISVRDFEDNEYCVKTLQELECLFKKENNG